MIRGLAPMPAGVTIDGLVRLLAASRKILLRSTKYDAKHCLCLKTNKICPFTPPMNCERHIGKLAIFCVCYKFFVGY